MISLTITKPLIEVRLETMQQTEVRLKFVIIIDRSKVLPIVSPKKQLRPCHAIRGIQNITPEAGHNH